MDFDQKIMSFLFNRSSLSPNLSFALHELLLLSKTIRHKGLLRKNELNVSELACGWSLLEILLPVMKLLYNSNFRGHKVNGYNGFY